MALHIGKLVAYLDSEGIALDRAESERLLADAGDKRVVCLHNHGTLVLGLTMPGVFHLMLMLEKACRAQVAAQSGRAHLRVPPREACEHAGRQHQDELIGGGHIWPAILRLLDREDPSYCD